MQDENRPGAYEFIYPVQNFYDEIVQGRTGIRSSDPETAETDAIIVPQIPPGSTDTSGIDPSCPSFFKLDSIESILIKLNQVESIESTLIKL